LDGRWRVDITATPADPRSTKAPFSLQKEKNLKENEKKNIK